MEVRVKIEGLSGLSERMAKQARFAAAVALTKTAQEVRRAIPAELDRVFDRPTTFTRSGTYLKAATRQQLVAEVGFKPIQSKYLRLQADGGVYMPRETGIKLPGNIQLNAFGNIPRGTISKLKAAAQNGQLSAAVAKRLNVQGNRRKGAAPIQLFFGIPRGKGWEGAPLGIWRRVPGVSGGPGKLIPVIVFEDTPAKYQKRLDLEGMAKPIVSARFEGLLANAMRLAVGTAR
jgi:hypothetical protein